MKREVSSVQPYAYRGLSFAQQETVVSRPFQEVVCMDRLKWLAIGVAATAFLADYVGMKASWRDMEAVVVKAQAVATREQATSVACLSELVASKSITESLVERKKLAVIAQVDALQMLEKARNGDAEAMAFIGELGFTVSKPGKRLAVNTSTPSSRGGFP